MIPATLRGDRVVLSSPGADDIDRVTECCRDPAVQRWTTVPSPYERDDAEHFVLDVVSNGWATGTACTWAIRFEPAGTLMGMIGLDHASDDAAEIGYWLAPEARGSGVMSEAVSLVCEFGFADPSSAGVNAGLALRRIEWHAFVGNVASAAVARRAGFRFEGARRLGGAQRGSRLDDWSAALLRDDPRVPAPGWPAEAIPR